MVTRKTASSSAPATATAPATVKARRTRRKDERPAELMDAALSLFTEKGFAATRVEEIAFKAGVSKGTLFLYYPSKEDLFQAVVRHTVNGALSRAQHFALNYNGSCADLLRQLIQIWWHEYGSTNARTIPKLIITEASHFPDCASFYEKEVLAPARAIVKQTVERGMASGEFRPDIDLTNAWLSVHSLLVYLSIWGNNWHGKHTDQPIDANAFVRHQTEMIIRGLQTPEREKPLTKSPAKTR